MGFFSHIAQNVSPLELGYRGANEYMHEMLSVSDSFLKQAGKSRPSAEETFNAILSFAAITCGYTCMDFAGSLQVDPVLLIKETRDLLRAVKVNPQKVAQNEVERHKLQEALEAKAGNSSHYSGDLAASILFASRSEQFVNGCVLAKTDSLRFPEMARDYALIMIRAYSQEYFSLLGLYMLVQTYITVLNMNLNNTKAA
jgi:hypothetical protein